MQQTPRHQSWRLDRNGENAGRSGKQVVLSTLALVQASSELGELKRYVDNGEFLIEASDLGVVNLRRTQATVRRRACAELLQRRYPAPAAETGHGALVHAGGTLP